MEANIAMKYGWNHLINHGYYYRNCYRVRKLISKMKLKMVSNTKIPSSKDEIRLFAIVRNEELRLPYFLKYYEKLSVDRFFFVDNASNDETLDIIQKAPNAHIFRSYESFKNHWNWMELLLDKYGLGHWCLVVDADEIFYYPYCEKLSLKEFCDFLDLHKHEAVKNLLIDVYPKDCIKKTQYKKGENPLDHYTYFDNNYFKVNRIHLNRKKWKLFWDPVYYGGVRFRVFGGSKLGYLSKVSLIRYKKNAYLRKGMHSVDGLKYSDLRGVVFHTKFLHDIFDKIKIAVNEEQYFNKSIVYRLYNRVLTDRNNLIFYDKSNSIKFQNTDMMIKQGFIKSNNSLDLLVREKQLD